MLPQYGTHTGIHISCVGHNNQMLKDDFGRRNPYTRTGQGPNTYKRRHGIDPISPNTDAELYLEEIHKGSGTMKPGYPVGGLLL
jgi:hypothetical protein